jgi:hypothetical protein
MSTREHRAGVLVQAHEQVLHAGGREQVVVVQVLHELAARELEDAREVAREAQPRHVALVAHAGVRAGLDDGADLLPGAVVAHHHLEVGPGLRERAGEGLLEESRGVGRDEDRDERRHRAGGVYFGRAGAAGTTTW